MNRFLRFPMEKPASFIVAALFAVFPGMVVGGATNWMCGLLTSGFTFMAYDVGFRDGTENGRAESFKKYEL